MNAKTLAELLDGNEYRLEVTREIDEQAKAAGLVLVEFRGAIHAEADCYDGGTVLVDGEGLLRNRDQIEDDDELEDYFNRRKSAKLIEALWCVEGDYSWTYRTDIPHETFEVLEDGEPYCCGIVFALADLAGCAPECRCRYAAAMEAMEKWGLWSMRCVLSTDGTVGWDVRMSDYGRLPVEITSQLFDTPLAAIEAAVEWLEENVEQHGQKGNPNGLHERQRQ